MCFLKNKGSLMACKTYFVIKFELDESSCQSSLVDYRGSVFALVAFLWLIQRAFKVVEWV